MVSVIPPYPSAKAGRILPPRQREERLKERKRGEVAGAKSHAVVWIRTRLRNDLVLLDPYPCWECGFGCRARKLTKINKITWIPVFQKGCLPMKFCVMTYYIHKVYFSFKNYLFVPAKFDQDPDPDPRLGRKAGSGSGSWSGSALKPMRQRRHIIVFLCYSLSPST